MNIRWSHKTFALFLHSAIILAISYIIVSFFISSTKSLSFFSVIDESGDVPMSDMYLFFNSRKGPARLDTNIVLVNVDICKNRFEIAQLIEQINSLHPKVIGLDVIFRNQKNREEDMILENAIRTCKNIVVTCVLDAEHRESNDVYSNCSRNFFVDQRNDSITEGFINLDSDGDSPVQTFTPKLYLQKENFWDTLYCFAAQIVRVCDETAFQKLLQRTGNLELINFQPLRFNQINKNDMEDNPELIAGKIVLIGSFSEDLHKTPISLQMQGLEIHTQIISTILDGKYINRLDNIWTKILNILLCYLFTLFCWITPAKLTKGVSTLIKLAQVTILFLAFFAGYYLFNHYNIDITYARTILVMGVVTLIADIYDVGITYGSKFITFCSKYIHTRKKIIQYENDNN